MAWRESTRRRWMQVAWTIACVSGAMWFGLVLGRPLSYTDGGRAIGSGSLRDDSMVRWTAPVAELEVPARLEGRFARLPDGRLLFAATAADGSTDLCTWDPATNGAPEPAYGLNTRDNELAPAVDAAGRIWFASDRPGGAGGYDLYVAAARGTGFAPPQPVVACNTRQDEVDPAPSPEGARLVFARVDRDVDDGRNGELWQWRLDDPSDPSPLFDPPERGRRRSDRDPAFHPDGAALWFVRQEGATTSLGRSSRLGDRFAAPQWLSQQWPSLALRAPLPIEPRRLWLLQPGREGERSLLHASAAIDVHPWWPGQRWLEWLLASVFGVALLLLLLLHFGRRWSTLDLVAQCLLLSLLLHALLFLWLMGVEIAGALVRDGDGGEGMEVTVVPAQLAGGSGGAGSGDFAAMVRFEPTPRELTVATPGSNVARERVASIAAATAAPMADSQEATTWPTPSTALADAVDPVPAPSPEGPTPRPTPVASIAPAGPFQRQVAMASPTPATPMQQATREALADGRLSLVAPAATVLPSSASRAASRAAGRAVSSESSSESGSAVAVDAGAALRLQPAPSERAVAAAAPALRDAATTEAIESRPASPAAGIPAPSTGPAAQVPAAPSAAAVSSGPPRTATSAGAPAAPAVPMAGLATPARTPVPAAFATASPRSRPAPLSNRLPVKLRDAAPERPRTEDGRAGAETRAAVASSGAAPTPPAPSLPPDPRHLPTASAPRAVASAATPLAAPPPAAEVARRLAVLPPVAGRRSARHDAPTLASPPPIQRLLHDRPVPAPPPAGAVAERPSRAAVLPSIPFAAVPTVPLPFAATQWTRREAPAPASLPLPIVSPPDSEVRRGVARAVAPVAAAGPRVERSAYSNRFGPAKAVALEQFGGTADTERAVASGLRYLASVQHADGSWGDRRDFDGKYGLVYVGKTALCLLAFLGAGHTPGTATEYSEVSARALRHLLQLQQQDTGAFGVSSCYGHGIATYALAECYGLTRDPQLLRPLERALDWILQHQGPRRDARNRGGWGYFSPQLDAEDSYARVSVTSWMVMALESARLSGIELPERVLPDARRYLELSYDRPNGWFRYNHKPSRLRSGWPTLPASTPAAAFCLQLLGAGADDPMVQQALDYTVARRPRSYDRYGDEAFVLQGQGNVYFWYYASLCCFLAGGERWAQWNERLRELLPAAQLADGSFPPIDVYSEQAGDGPDDHSYTTAMCVLSLEVYYRYFTPLLLGR